MRTAARLMFPIMLPPGFSSILSLPFRLRNPSG
jgi:hypothetical protein